MFHDPAVSQCSATVAYFVLQSKNVFCSWWLQQKPSKGDWLKESDSKTHAHTRSCNGLTFTERL